MRSMGFLARVPNQILLPIVLLITLTAIYVQETSIFALWTTFGFGIVGYLFRRCDIPVLPFVIAFILAGPLEQTAREAFAATGGNPWFLFSSLTAVVFMLLAITSVVGLGRR